MSLTELIHLLGAFFGSCKGSKRGSRKLMQSRSILSQVLAVAASLGIFTFAAAAKVLRVCADPDYLPYSNRAGEGFENKVAAVLAQTMGRTLEYHWASYRGAGGFSNFLADNLDAGKCDVVMNLP